ncbi:MAG: T9SS type A sorting domain-containing protein [Bacteroidales bacterium]|nr:T9SS type A sorting domain-containing protein [Bacteroidales bacterium]
MPQYKHISFLFIAGSLLTLVPFFGFCQEAVNDTLKSAKTTPFEVKLNYDFYDCGGQLVSIAQINGQPPFFWYELDSLGKRVNNKTWINPKPQQLNNETLYLVEDAWQRRDTIYISFDQSVEFYGLHPNPFKENFAILYDADISLPVHATIFDLTGKYIEERNFVLDTEKNALFFNPGLWPKGTYILKLQSRCFNQTMKVVYMGE